MSNDKTYAADLKFLNKHTPIVELDAGGDAHVAVAPQYQGRVMTSTLAGGKGASFGWLNEAFIEAGQNEPKFNNYGGEDRFWLGPEGGQFALFFKNGDPFHLDYWTTPEGLNNGTFSVTSQGKRSVAMARNFSVTNFSGTSFDCAVKRTIRTVDADRSGELLGAAVPSGVSMVGFESVNVLANAGKTAWTRDSGLLSVWILGQFKPLPNGHVIVPFIPGPDSALGKKATTDYFGPIPEDRCSVGEEFLSFAVDGEVRGKIGVAPSRIKNVLGSYDPDGGVLTVVQFNLPAGATKLPYINSLWEIQDAPFAGDVINSYNDGPAEPGAESFGGFYEIETSSPAAELPPGGAITHVHRTFHFAGDKAALRMLGLAALGVDITEIA